MACLVVNISVFSLNILNPPQKALLLTENWGQSEPQGLQKSPARLRTFAVPYRPKKGPNVDPE